MKLIVITEIELEDIWDDPGCKKILRSKINQAIQRTVDNFCDINPSSVININSRYAQWIGEDSVKFGYD